MTRASTRTSNLWWLSTLMAIVALGMWAKPVRAASSPSDAVTVSYRTLSGVSLAQILAGKPGRGLLLFYLRTRGPSRPAVVVRFDNSGGRVVADLYEAPHGQVWVDVHRLPRIPTIRMVAVGGWWVRHGIPNYNLNVTVYDALPGMVATLYRREVKGGRPIFYIETRANSQGMPTWQADWLLVPLKGSTYPSFGYDRSECPNPWVRQGSAYKPWPFVVGDKQATAGDDVLVVPVVVNWSRGQILAFDSPLSVHNESCVYAINSDQSVPLHSGVGKPDFESPWGDYNLSSHGTGYPNLVVHTFYSYPNDPTSTVPRALPAGLRVPPQEDVRYSWADHVGNLRFSFKVDVYGHYGYSSVIPVGTTGVHVQAPSYRAWPAWVIGKSWPVVALVEPQFDVRQTSEGIYTWDAVNVGRAYDFGLTPKPRLRSFRTIPVGYRGELRWGAALPIRLYASPIDGRLHLMGARVGLWNLGGGQELREENLTGGPYIDEWERVQTSRSRLPAQLARGVGTVSPVRDPGAVTHVESTLLALPGGALLLADQDGVTWVSASLPASVLELTPPTSPASWVGFTKAAAPWLRGKNPLNLTAWIARTAGARTAFAGATVSDVSVRAKTYSFVLTIPKGTPPVSFPGGRNMTPGPWWVVGKPGQPLRVVAAKSGRIVEQTRVAEDSTTSVEVVTRLINEGTLPWRGRVALMSGNDLLTEKSVALGGHSTLRLKLWWLPGGARGPYPVRLALGSRVPWRGTLDILPLKGPGALQRVEGSLPPLAPLAPLAALCMLAGIFLVGRRVAS